ncbi:hypothetical protein BJV85_002111 [Clostridium acetobutylicum]|uniref:Uncharacterized protein n=1 Tax=Clostridium acetobutylicum (strain ATCC 824 / DSM 792 / JCM 1419 / IAM 19013 / LMG 5710 / NBRC 13948 / NRRL B-527 / VKM B-1787 / 2291 / W) TaxID=272562 RepID=Q97HX1_CLOAB|nr:MULTISPECIES: hypothetical protein [Clostridium]AAK79849.1 Hypothetical protein CA_C1885 [Clostridium acetobutylicum ATCC 824]ADZ20935.1 Conserved hypothetical protein [Clostridium acetobutylicum EA 2018]AEI32025.1 hypothetical protein SMB_G1910 [Clostridium acetobutylicum DSM 1731]AWV79721.1 hypothetical protein DK921_06335 [Clostridium acetobutylicum]MBC2394301.1 hypothetical protein [Clostridium acetobutylicum]
MSEIKDLRQEGVKTNIGGKEVNLYFDLNDLCDLEEEYGDATKALEAIRSIKGARHCLWIAMRKANEEITEKEVGALIPSSDFTPVTSNLAKALWGSLPEQKNEGTKENK